MKTIREIEIKTINDGNELTDSIWQEIGYFIGATLRGDTFRHQHGRTGYF